MDSDHHRSYCAVYWGQLCPFLRPHLSGRIQFHPFTGAGLVWLSDLPEIGRFTQIRSAGITFFALMGMALDQPGNILYNKGIECVYCPENSGLEREAVSRGMQGGGVQVSQKFECIDRDSGELARQINMFELLAVRFGEYVLIGYLLLGVSRLYNRL